MKWTEPMRELLRDSYRARGAAWCASFLGVSPCAVYSMALRLGIPLHDEPAAYVKWTRDERELLRQHAGEKGLAWCAERLGRSEGAVRREMYRMGIKKRGEK